MSGFAFAFVELVKRVTQSNMNDDVLRYFANRIISGEYR